MVNLTIAVPENILFALREDNTEFSNNMKRFTALKLYELGKLSLGQGAELAGMDKRSFIAFLSEHHVSVFSHMNMEDLKRDVANA